MGDLRAGKCHTRPSGPGDSCPGEVLQRTERRERGMVFLEETGVSRYLPIDTACRCGAFLIIA